MITKNFKFLRKQNGETQEEFAKRLGIKRANVGAYEEGRAKPSYELLLKLSEEFDLTVDSLLTKNLALMTENERSLYGRFDPTGKKIRVLSITVDEEDKENIELVPVKASAGYLNGYADPEYLEDLPKFRLPMLPHGTYRAFEIKGDSMLPLQPGSLVVGEYVQDWTDLKDGHTYIILSKEDGVVYKRVFNHLQKEATITCQSDNPSYPPFDVHAKDIIEIWKAKLFITMAEPHTNQTMQQNEMVSLLGELQKQIQELKEKN